MIVQREFLNKLRDFGLNTYESKLWTALLSRGISTAGELSDIANVPRSRAYDVLESLEKKGFIVMKLGKPIKYIAVPPAEVVERVKKKLKEDADKQTSIIDQLRGSEVLDELNLLHTQGVELIEPMELSGALKGRGNLYNHLESMINGAEKTICIMTSEEGFSRKIDSFTNSLRRAKERGVTVKIAVTEMTPKSKKMINTIKDFAQVRGVDIKARFFVVDGKEITFMLVDDKSIHPTYDSGVWVNTKLFAKAVEDMFNLAWEGKAEITESK
jgi:HTH-type transcriptional regulator, sugar sensing transcriptional regulator